jgi:hypothetical protein
VIVLCPAAAPTATDRKTSPVPEDVPTKRILFKDLGGRFIGAVLAVAEGPAPSRGKCPRNPRYSMTPPPRFLRKGQACSDGLRTVPASRPQGPVDYPGNRRRSRRSRLLDSDGSGSARSRLLRSPQVLSQRVPVGGLPTGREVAGVVR